MKTKILLPALLFVCIAVHSNAQRNCGQAIMLQHLEEIYPGANELIDKERAKVFENALKKGATKGVNYKTTSSILIPCVFHFVIDSNTFNSLGGISGIEERVYTQMTVINNDFNGSNADKIKVPSVWASIFGNTGIGFGLAHFDPSGAFTPGYDIKIIPNGTKYDAVDAAKAAKFSAAGGTDSWDNNKYLNIWVTSIIASGTTALGITVPPAFPGYTLPELGIVINYLSFGSRTNVTQPFLNHFDKGRTLSHELGHYFYLIHTWGDDAGLCPDTGGKDDGIADTPPESDATYNAPSFPRLDACSPTGSGIMFMNYMDYTDDTAMFMFTKEQADVMLAELLPGGHSDSLTHHPNLADTNFKLFNGIKIYPNPATDYINIDYNILQYKLLKVEIVNMLGQRVVSDEGQNLKTIHFSGLASGIYIVHCYFKNEIYSQKIRIN